jgi:hypothetical protein
MTDNASKPADNRSFTLGLVLDGLEGHRRAEATGLSGTVELPGLIREETDQD